MSRGGDSARVYIGDLGSGGSKPELEREFERYGPLKSVWVARNPPGFAFVEFEDPRDAEDAVRDMDGKRVCGVSIRVEIAKNSSRAGGGGGGRRRDFGGGGGGGGGGGYGRSRYGGGNRSPPRYRRGSPRCRDKSRSPDRRGGGYSRSRSPSPSYNRKGRERESPEYR